MTLPGGAPGPASRTACSIYSRGARFGVDAGAVSGGPPSDWEQSIRIGGLVRLAGWGVGDDCCVVGVTLRDFEVREVMQERGGDDGIPFVEIEPELSVAAHGREVDRVPRRREPRLHPRTRLLVGAHRRATLTARVDSSAYCPG